MYRIPKNTINKAKNPNLLPVLDDFLNFRNPRISINRLTIIMKTYFLKNNKAG